MARPQLQAALAFCREGDILVVSSMDRLARSLADLLSLVKGLTARGVAVQFVKESLTFTGDDAPIACLLLSMLGAVAQFERDLILERIRDGVQLARKAGKYKGRKRSISEARIAELLARLQKQRWLKSSEFRARHSIPTCAEILQNLLSPWSGRHIPH
jgi:DNA invertase Pin-like site-specific DNA recombinase